MSSSGRAIPLAGSGVAFSGGATFLGVTLRETAGAAATVTVHAGTDDSGTILEVVALTASASASRWLGDRGLWSPDGIYVAVVGSVEGSVRIA